MTADSDLFNTELPAQQAEDPQALRGLTNDELDAVLSKSGDQDPATTRRLLAMRDKDTLVRVDRALVSEFGGVWQKSKAAVSEGMKGLSRALLSTYDLSQEVGGQTPDGQWTFGGQVSKDVRETVRGQIDEQKAAPLTRSDNWMENAYYDFLSATPTVAAQIGATVLNPALGTAFMSAVVAGSTNEDLQGVDLKYRLPAVTLDATVGAALERVGIGRVLPRGVLSKGFEKELVRRALKGVATDPVVKRTMLGAFGKSLAGAVGTEAATESLQSVSNQLIVDMTKSLDDANGDWNLAADNFMAQLDPADVAKQAAWEGLIGGMFGFLGVARAAQDASVAAERTKSMVSAANVIAKAVNQDQAIEAAGAIAQKTGMSEEFVVMDSLLFQEKFGDRAAEVAAKMGITQDQFDLALATGSELEVPAVHALLAGEDLQLIAPILKHVGIDAGRLNLAENSTGDIVKQISGMVETSLTPNAKPAALKQKVEEIYTAATEAGIAKFTKGDADAIGSLLYARARVFAPELGLTVDEYLAQAPAFTAAGFPQTGGNQLEQSAAYHGSPHNILANMNPEDRRFMLKNIGTGEGAQAFGWGLYFTSEENIARWYADTLSKKTGYDVSWPDGVDEQQKANIVKQVGTLGGYSGLLNSTRNQVAKDKELVAFLGGPSAVSDVVREGMTRRASDLAVLERMKEEDFKKVPRNLYKVDLWKDKQENLLSWNETIAPEIAAKIAGDFPEDVIAEYESKFHAPLSEWTGRTTYKALEHRAKKSALPGTPEDDLGGGPSREASQYLLRKGLDGIRFPAASLGAGDGAKGWNYVVFDDAAVSIVEHELYQGTRGAIDRSTKLISLFKGEADRSTILHEMFHGFHLELMDVAPSSKVAQETLAAFNEFTKDISGDRGKMEHLAKAFEAYLQEGKAPSAPLKRAFTKFKTWLVAIYRSLGLGGVKLNDEIRGTFDRMLATENEIDVIQAEYGLTENFTTFLGEYLTPKTKKVIDDAKKQTDAEMESKMLHRSIRAYAKRSGKEEAIRKDVAKRVNEDPAYEALKYVTAEGGVRKDELIALVGEKKAEALIAANPKVIGGGLSLDSLNAHLALQPTPTNAVDLFSTLASYPDVDTRIEELVETELALYEESVRSGKAEQEALDAAEETDDTPEEFLSESRLEYLTMQYAALTQKIEASQLRSFARAEIAATKVAAKKALETQPSAKAVNAAGYTRAASKHAKEAVKIAKRLGAMNVKEDATAKKSAEVVDTTGSVNQIEGAMDAVAKAEESRRSLEEKLEAALRAQKLCHAMAMEAMKLNKERNKILASVKKLVVVKNKDGRRIVRQNYSDLIRDIANTYGISDAQPERPDAMLSLAEFAASGDGELSVVDLTAPGWLTNYSEDGPKNYGTLKMDQLRELNDYLKLIKAQGNLEMEAMKRMVGKSTLEEITPLLDEVLARHKTEAKKVNPDSAIASILMTIANYKAESLAAQSLFKMADLGDKGPFQDIFFRPLERLLDKKLKHTRDLQRGPLKQFGALSQAFRERIVKERGWNFKIEDLPMEQTGFSDMTPERAIAVVLNCGTESGKAALLGGFGWDETHLDKVKALFTKKDVEMFQLVWDMNDSLFAGADDTDMEIYGRRAKKLEPVAVDFTFADGTTESLRGGYYHLSYNPAVNLTAFGFTQEDILKANTVSSQRMQGAKRGFMKGRKDVTNLPVRLDLGVVDEHVSEALHYTYLGSYVNDIAKVVKDPNFASSFRKVMGDENYKTLIPWLSKIARPTGEPVATLDRIASGLVGLGSIDALGFKLTTAMANLSAFGNVIAKIGIKTYASGMLASLTGKDGKRPDQWFRYVNEIDPRMQDRLSKITSETSKLVNRAGGMSRYQVRVGDKVYTKEDAAAVALGGITAMDAMVSYPAYIGVFRKVLQETGDVEKAKDAGWEVVVGTQPYSSPLYQSVAQQEKSFRYVMPLSGWIMKLGGILRSDYYLWRNGAMSNFDFGYKFALNVIAPVVFTSYIREAIRGDEGEDDKTKDLALDVVGSTFGWIPGVSVLGGVLQYGAQSAGTHVTARPIIKGIAKPILEAEKLAEGKKDDSRDFLWSLCEAAGLWTKLPVGNLYKSVAQGVELIEDEEGSR